MIATERQDSKCPFVGRHQELDFLERLTSGRLPSITFLHGLGGLGKSRLLDAFAQRQRAAGAVVVRIDCRDVEPTEAGVFRALSLAVGGEILSCEGVTRRLAALGTVVLELDEIDALRLLDAWLRRALIPALPPNVHVIFCSRNAPVSAWLQMPWPGAFQTLELAPLDDLDALALLQAHGVEPKQAARVNRMARGHPLALTLAAITLQGVYDPAFEGEDVAFHRIIDELARRHLADIPDPATRRTVEAASVVRSVSAPLLGAMLPDLAPSDAYERLRSLPLVHLSRDGLQLHDTVRDAIASNLRVSDPERYLTYRRACWSRLNRDLSTAPSSELWRYTADLLYLLENPVLREGFFPSGAQRFAFEPAYANDETAILEITERHDGPAAAQATSTWFKYCADAFCVVRGPDGDVNGYYILLDAGGIDALVDDPVIAKWTQHLAAHPVAAGERVLGHRRLLSRNDGDLPCAVQASCWVDIKRTYMANRPFLRRVYISIPDVVFATYAPAITRLGFRVLAECAADVAGKPYTTAMLDFGAESVDGWFAKLVAAELGIATSELLDIGARELVVGSRRAPLTPREFDTVHYLMQRKGSVVDREEVLAEVWGAESEVASNVVDVVIRSLRKKLGTRANTIETVSGVGYRFRES